MADFLRMIVNAIGEMDGVKGCSARGPEWVHRQEWQGTFMGIYVFVEGGGDDEEIARTILSFTPAAYRTMGDIEVEVPHAGVKLRARFTRKENE